MELGSWRVREFTSTRVRFAATWMDPASSNRSADRAPPRLRERVWLEAASRVKEFTLELCLRKPGQWQRPSRCTRGCGEFQSRRRKHALLLHACVAAAEWVLPMADAEFSADG